MKEKCPICNKPKCENCKCLNNLQEQKQVLIEDATMSTFGFNNAAEIKINK